MKRIISMVLTAAAAAAIATPAIAQAAVTTPAPATAAAPVQRHGGQRQAMRGYQWQRVGANSWYRGPGKAGHRHAAMGRGYGRTGMHYGRASYGRMNYRAMRYGRANYGRMYYHGMPRGRMGMRPRGYRGHRGYRGYHGVI